MRDCTNVITLISERNRMCGYQRRCADCPLNEIAEYECDAALFNMPQQFIAIVQRWSDAHQLKTWRDLLLERLPDVNIGLIVENACPSDLFGPIALRKGTECDAATAADCQECWSRPVPEELR